MAFAKFVVPLMVEASNVTVLPLAVNPPAAAVVLSAQFPVTVMLASVPAIMLAPSLIVALSTIKSPSIVAVPAVAVRAPNEELPFNVISQVLANRVAVAVKEFSKVIL